MTGIKQRIPTFAAFPKNYVDDLPKAPKLYRIGELVNPADLGESSWASKGGLEIEDGAVPTVPGRVVLLLQLKLGGSGYIRVRWGTAYTPESVLAEYHFGPNEELGQKEN